MPLSDEDQQFQTAMQCAKQGDLTSLGSLLETFRPLLSQIARQGVGNRLQIRMSGSDLVQETMLTASQCFADFRGQTKGELQAWLLQILQARLVDGIRRHMLAERRKLGAQQANSASSVHSPASSPSSLASLNEQSARLILALTELDENQRSILLMRYSEQLSFESIAQRLSIPLSTVWRQWSRAIDLLRRHLPNE
ncbi:MAG: sigma-70 family RNA polymerase sigma factor [Planctomycetales bacterium]|nr:sigma-70 family RNA polymerase sigma factor [Planctomycetales bacterium]